MGFIADNTNGSWFDRSLTIKGLELVVAGDVGGQTAVPDYWASNIAQTIDLLIDPDSIGINELAQNNLIASLSGAAGTWHEGFPAAQRIANGGGDEYSPDPLADPSSYPGYEPWADSRMVNDMVWYQNTSHGDISISIENQINEVLEHLMHTIHLYGVRGAVDGSFGALMGNDVEVETSEEYKSHALYLAMEEAIDSGVFSPDYLDAPDNVLLKEYTYLLNFNMWEFGKEFWEDDNGDGLGSLAPEWSDAARDPSDILTHNPLGHALFETYFEPVLSRPDPSALREIFTVYAPAEGQTSDSLVTQGSVSRLNGSGHVLSDGVGAYSDLEGTGSISLVGGQEALTGRSFKGIYTSLSDSAALSPLTTVAERMIVLSLASGIDDAFDQIARGLGLGSEFSIGSNVASLLVQSSDSVLGRDALALLSQLSVATQIGSEGDPMLGLKLYEKIAATASSAAAQGLIFDLADEADLSNCFSAGDYALNSDIIQRIYSAMLDIEAISHEESSTLEDFEATLLELALPLVDKSHAALRFWASDSENWMLLPGVTIQAKQSDADAFIVHSSALSSVDFSSVESGSYALELSGVDISTAVNITDAVSILKDIVGLSALSGFARHAADVNGDERVDISDAVLALKMIVGLENVPAPIIFDHLGNREIAFNGFSNYDLYVVILGDVDGSGVSLL